jgi:hypothetical protein
LRNSIPKLNISDEEIMKEINIVRKK